MTLKEFYAAVGGDYDATLNRIPKESMVLRFAKKYADDKTYAHGVPRVAHAQGRGAEPRL